MYFSRISFVTVVVALAVALIRSLELRLLLDDEAAVAVAVERIVRVQLPLLDSLGLRVTLGVELAV